MAEACGKVCPAEHLTEWAHRSCRKPEGSRGRAHLRRPDPPQVRRIGGAPMTRPSRRVADYAPSTLERSAELVLAAAVEEAVALLRSSTYPQVGLRKATLTMYAAAQSADLILGRAR